MHSEILAGFFFSLERDDAREFLTAFINSVVPAESNIAEKERELSLSSSCRIIY